MEFLFIVGRVLFAFLFLMSGIGHLTATAAMTGYAQYKKVPFAKVSVILSGVMILLGAVSIALGVLPTIGAALIALFLLPTAFLMHAYWNETDAQAKQTEMIAFNKDISLAGAALVLVYVFATFGDALPFILVK